MKMKKIMKKVSVLVTLCMIMTTLSAQPIFAAGTYTVDNGGVRLPQSLHNERLHVIRCLKCHRCLGS